jgi:hypothetical protein
MPVFFDGYLYGDAGYRMLDARYWGLGTGGWMLDAWMLDTGYWMWRLCSEAGYAVKNRHHAISVAGCCQKV